MIELNTEQRRFLRALAHHLKPTVMIGNQGLTESVMRELARNLDAHELIKVRVLGDERETRVALMTEICEHLECAPVQHIGKLLLLYRPGAEPKIELPVGKKKALPAAKAPKVETKPKIEVRIDKGRPGGNRRRQMGNRQR